MSHPPESLASQYVKQNSEDWKRSGFAYELHPVLPQAKKGVRHSGEAGIRGFNLTSPPSYEVKMSILDRRSHEVLILRLQCGLPQGYRRPKLRDYPKQVHPAFRRGRETV